jgi:hypothetical protein
VPHEDYDAISREVAPIHIGNCMSALRRSLRWLNPSMQALAAIRAGSLLERGPSILNATFEFVPYEATHDYPDSSDVALLEGCALEQLLADLRPALFAHDYNRVTAIVQRFIESGASPEPLIALLTEVACTDSGTILHNFKHLNSMVNAFALSQHPHRWKYLAQAARFMAWYAGLHTHVYKRASAALI